MSGQVLSFDGRSVVPLLRPCQIKVGENEGAPRPRSNEEIDEIIEGIYGKQHVFLMDRAKHAHATNGKYLDLDKFNRATKKPGKFCNKKTLSLADLQTMHFNGNPDQSM